MRWRATKKGGRKEQKSTLPSYAIAPFQKRFKAFVVDSFMLLMPILYIIFYMIYGSREGFAAHMFQGWLLILIPYGIVTIIFLKRSGQTPGYKAYDLTLIDLSTGQSTSVSHLFLRYILMLLTVCTIIGIFVPLMRKDKLSLYDLGSRSAPIYK
ncbi:RDD family protein [Sulfurospirillum sp.]|uniref:RDD family protein n=1 Tax=Sulfurospirillum sp. TaxID=2053622 RepID=UPI002FDCE265